MAVPRASLCARAFKGSCLCSAYHTMSIRQVKAAVETACVRPCILLDFRRRPAAQQTTPEHPCVAPVAGESLR
eukprot:scaffold38454_cov15-Tisochrysis_lutea.AAC.1